MSQPMMPFIDLAAQQARIRPAIDRAIARVLDHGQYIMGPEVEELERQLATFTGARHAIGCASGTDALLMSMLALGLKAGDAVLCPALTFTATPEAAALLGATPVFVDVDAATFNLAAEGIAAGCATARAHGLRPAGIIAVDLYGLPADYAAIEAVAREEGLWVLADAAQSFGAELAGRRVGTFGRMTATSFFPAKPLGCYGDGGAIFTDDDELAAAARSIRLHGKAEGGDKYDIERVGVNGRLDTLQAAILLEKLKIFPGEIERRREIAGHYTRELAPLVRTPEAHGDALSAWAQYTIRVPADRRGAIMDALKKGGVPTAVYYPRPLHHQVAYRSFPVSTAGLAICEQLAGEVLSLPMHPYLTDGEISRVAASLGRALKSTPGS